jgi:hypothetical protein
MDIDNTGRKQGWPYHPAYNATLLNIWFDEVIGKVDEIWRDFDTFELDGILDLDTTVEAYEKNQDRIDEISMEISFRADSAGEILRDLQRAIKIAKEELEAMPRLRDSEVMIV